MEAKEPSVWIDDWLDSHLHHRKYSICSYCVHGDCGCVLFFCSRTSLPPRILVCALLVLQSTPLRCATLLDRCKGDVAELLQLSRSSKMFVTQAYSVERVSALQRQRLGRQSVRVVRRSKGLMAGGVRFVAVVLLLLRSGESCINQLIERSRNILVDRSHLGGQSYSSSLTMYKSSSYDEPLLWWRRLSSTYIVSAAERRSRRDGTYRTISTSDER